MYFFVGFFKNFNLGCSSAVECLARFLSLRNFKSTDSFSISVMSDQYEPLEFMFLVTRNGYY